MDRIGGFDPGVGIVPLHEGASEIGRGNLPEGQRLLPGDIGSVARDIFGRGSDSSLMERLSAYLSTELTHRELLVPEAFFASLEAAADSFLDRARSDGVKDGPLVEAARQLATVIGDRELCEALRRLIVKA